jgi:dimethylhistidine N-methyltransferase
MPVSARVSPISEPRKPSTAFAADVLAGLKAEPKSLPAKYFYDSAGSHLFERITQLPEYYPTRTELDILKERAGDIARLLPNNAALIEFGSGSGAKASILLGAAPQVAAYVPVDISSEVLHQEADLLRRAFPNVKVVPIDADFYQSFDLPADLDVLPRAGFFPGSTIGNFEPHEACTFMRNAGGVLGADAKFIIGVDLVKDRAVLHAAYNDAAGVTAAFNLNLLMRINRELGANFNPDCFEHHAFFNRERSRVEMHLASIKRQKVRICGETIDFRAGETIHTENSYKYTIEAFTALARGSGFDVHALWTDRQKYFAVYVLVQGHGGEVEKL